MKSATSSRVGGNWLAFAQRRSRRGQSIFAFAPFYSIYAGGFNVNGTASFLDSDGNPMARDDSEWRDACNNYRDDASKAKLAAMGLS